MTHTKTSTLTLITVLFEDLFEAITLHREFSGEKMRLEALTSLLNKTNTCDGYVFNTRFAWAGGTCPRFAWALGQF